MVSRNVPVMVTSPCRTGSSLLEQAAALGVVHLLGGGEGQQLVARAVQQLAGDFAQIRIGDVIRRADDFVEHFLRVAWGAGGSARRKC